MSIPAMSGAGNGDKSAAVFVALGANLPSRFGAPVDTLRAACTALDERGLRVVARSAVWLTAPVPLTDQPWFHNQVVEVETDLSPLSVLETLLAIEADFGRVRTVRNASRVLDLDLLAYGRTVINKPELIIPHPRLHERAFVLFPLQEVAGDDWEHPTLERSLAAMVAALPPGQEAQRLEV